MAHSARLLGIVTGILCVAFACSMAQAAPIIADLNDPQDSYTIEEVQNAGGIIVGDKLFDEFRVTTTTTANAIAPDASAIAVTGVKISGELGLRFNAGLSAWSVQANEYADTTIKFRVSITEPELLQGWVLTDNSLWMSAYATENNGLVSVSENIYALDPDKVPAGSPENKSIANKFVWYIDDFKNKVYDHKDFMDMTDPDPLNWTPLELVEIWVIKDVIANGGASIEPPGVAHISEFYQTFSQIPEPGTVALLAAGGVFVLLRRRRARL